MSRRILRIEMPNGSSNLMRIITTTESQIQMIGEGAPQQLILSDTSIDYSSQNWTYEFEAIAPPSNKASYFINNQNYASWASEAGTGYFDIILDTVGRIQIRFKKEKSPDPNFSLEIPGNIGEISPGDRIYGTLSQNDASITIDISINSTSWVSNGEYAADDDFSSYWPNILNGIIHSGAPNGYASTIYQTNIVKSIMTVDGSVKWSITDGTIDFGIDGTYTQLGGTSYTPVLAYFPPPPPPPPPFFDSSGGFASGQVNDIAVTPDGILVGGLLSTTYKGTTVNHLTRIDFEGNIDASFNDKILGYNINAQVRSVSVDASGWILVAGQFSTFDGTKYGYVRLDPDGNIDPLWSGDAMSGYAGMYKYIQNPNTLEYFLGGYFATHGSTSNKGLSKVDIHGNAIQLAEIGTGVTLVYNIAFTPDSSMLLGLRYTDKYKDTSVGGFIPVNSEGGIDTSFILGAEPNAGFNQNVTTVSYNNNKYYVGGVFNQYRGNQQRYAVRLETNGSVDDTYISSSDSGFNFHILDFYLFDNGDAIYGGSFTLYESTPYKNIVKLDASANIDTFFDVTGGGPTDGFNNNVYAIDVDPVNEKIYVGGIFTTFKGQNFGRIICLNYDGTIDGS